MDTAGPATHRLLAERTAINYVDWGNRAAPPLVLIHGGQDHARSWDWVAQRLRDAWHIVCPDLRGHGDSAWSLDGSYSMPGYVSDLARLIEQSGDRPVSIVAHSLGGAVALRYAGIFPERVRRLAVIEGLGLPLDEKPEGSVTERWREWIAGRHALSARQPRRYPDLDQACARMREANPDLSPEQARHLTIHGVNRNEDGSYGWKFDPYVRAPRLPDLTEEELHALWHAIDCPVWLVHGAQSWACHPGTDGRAAFFKQATVTSYERAGHWVHHDRLDDFVADLRRFLGEA